MNFPWIKEEKPVVHGPIKNETYYAKLSQQGAKPGRSKFDLKAAEAASAAPPLVDRDNQTALKNAPYYEKMAAPRPSHTTPKFSVPAAPTYRNGNDMGPAPNPEYFRRLAYSHAPSVTAKFEVRRAEAVKEEKLMRENMAALGPVVNEPYWNTLAKPVRPLDKIDHVPLTERVAATRERSVSPSRSRSFAMAEPTARAPRVGGTGFVAPPAEIPPAPPSDFDGAPRRGGRRMESPARDGGSPRRKSRSPRRETGLAASPAAADGQEPAQPQSSAQAPQQGKSDVPIPPPNQINFSAAGSPSKATG